jgi:hypothetical protein
MLKTSKIYKVSNEIARKELSECIEKCNIQQEEHGLKIPSHRKKEFISFEEYKEKILNGGFAKEIKKDTSKHLISFYNYFLKNQSTIINKETFESEYNKTTNSLNDIAKKYKIPREHITYLRDFYGIKRKGATFIKRLANEKPLSQEAKDVIVGSLLGDGHITPWGYFSEKHSEKQIEYLEHKASFLTPILNDNSFRADSYIDKRYKTKIYSFSVRTIVHSDLLAFRKMFYKQDNGKYLKILPENISELLNERVLAIWYMDDGYTDWGYRNGIKEYPNSLCQCKISSESFSYEENVSLKEILFKKWNLNSQIKFRDKNETKPYLRLDCKSSIKFTNAFKKYSTSDLLYKFDENEYLKHKCKNFDKEKLLKLFKDKYKIVAT